MSFGEVKDTKTSHTGKKPTLRASLLWLLMVKMEITFPGSSPLQSTLVSQVDFDLKFSEGDNDFVESGSRSRKA